MNDSPIFLTGRVVFFTGAGISVSAGLPTYRGTGGLYENTDLEPPSARDVARDRLPALWDRFRGRLDAAIELQPTAAHRHIAALEAHLPVDVVTQNVDGLHMAAGSSAVHQLHGSLRVLRCLDAGHQSTIDELRWGDDDVPLCPTCGDWCRPGVVLFGEGLAPDTWRAAETAMAHADTVVAVGTSAQVYPAASLIDSRHCNATTRVWIDPHMAAPEGWTWLQGDSDSQVARLQAR